MKTFDHTINLSSCDESNLPDGIHTFNKGDIVTYIKNGKFHREDGPAIEHGDGSQFWYENGLVHRDDGPAIEISHRKMWYRYGKLHRYDGPAVTAHFGEYNQWWLNGIECLSFDEWIEKLTKTDIEHATMMKLKYG